MLKGMSSSPSERRARSDRRGAPRGGRRSQDQPGTTPLILVVGNGGTPQRESETILRELKFAVAPAADMNEAVRIVEGLHPDLIVARREEALRLRANKSVDMPVVEYDDGARGADDLVERIRQAIRKRR